MAFLSWKHILFMQSLKEYESSIQHASFDTFKAKSISKQTLKIDYGLRLKYRPIVAPNMSKAYWMGLWYFYRPYIKTVGISGTVGHQKSGYFSLM